MFEVSFRRRPICLFISSSPYFFICVILHVKQVTKCGFYWMEFKRFSLAPFWSFKFACFLYFTPLTVHHTSDLDFNRSSFFRCVSWTAEKEGKTHPSPSLMSAWRRPSASVVLTKRCFSREEENMCGAKLTWSWSGEHKQLHYALPFCVIAQSIWTKRVFFISVCLLLL